MTQIEQKQLGKTLWDIADNLRGAMNADDLIKEQSNKIEQLKWHKKGLIQGLFPKVKN
jgi:type I restriction-modification system DNA methylase subunit